jgi:hypothetical protein
MRYWLIGCGSLFVIVLVLGYAGYRYIRGAAVEFKDELVDVTEAYARLEEERPFERPAGGVIADEKYLAFIACRKLMLADTEAYFAEIEDDETSWRRKISLAFSLMTELGRFHLAALRETGLSPVEYAWYVDLTLITLKYAESPDAPAGLRELRADIDELVSGEGARIRRDRDDMDVFADLDEKDDLSRMLPRVDPRFLDLPAETVSIAVRNGSGLRETAALFAFDAGFVEAIMVLLDAHRNGELWKKSDR